MVRDREFAVAHRRFSTHDVFDVLEFLVARDEAGDVAADVGAAAPGRP